MLSSISAPLKPSDFAAKVAQVELLGVAPALGQVNPENLGPFRLQGQIDEEDLVQAAFAQKLGRQVADVVGRGDDKDGRFFLREPR